MPKLLKQETKDHIYELRKKGYSVPEISSILTVPKSTVLRYASTVNILPKFRQRWLDRRNASKIISDKNLELANDFALKQVQSLSKKELLLIGAALYWAEGAKKDLSFINSDHQMVKVYILILKKVFNVKSEDLKVSLRLYEDVSIDDAINFWSDITGLKLGKSTSLEILKGSARGKLVYGMCRVRVKKSGLLLKTITAINKRVISLVGTM